MIRRLLLLVAALAAGGLPAARAEERIVSAAGAITEIVHALGAGDRLVAVDTTSVYPPAVQALPKVGYMRALSAEGVLSARPTLVLLSSDAGPPQVLDQLRAAGVKLAVIEDSHDAAGVPPKIRAVAAALGMTEGGEALARSVADTFTAIEQAIAKVPQRPRVLFVLSTGRGAPMAAGQNTAADAMIRLAGGDNAVRGYTGYKPLSSEAAAAAAPEIVLAMQQTVDQAGGADAFMAQLKLGATPAGRARRLVALDGSYLLGFGPRAPMAVADLARAIHPGIALP
ncbi:MAG TPA: ABC transporter substrate-binding protein [Alphaproteobacteria bacterium]|nr:ABC transporter substrate-binding protein [Alphaproteobacteria bacterium]